MALLIIDDGKISDSMSTVPITTINNVTATRTFAADYVNTTGKTMYVLLHIVLRSTQADGSVSANIYLDGDISKRFKASVRGPADNWNTIPILAVIKPGQTYRAEADTSEGTATIDRWYEIY